MNNFSIIPFLYIIYFINSQNCNFCFVHSFIFIDIKICNYVYVECHLVNKNIAR